MFTGIIETLGTIQSLHTEGSNLHIVVASPWSHELKIDQSVAHNGICLTVVAQDAHTHTVTAVAETIAKTNISNWNAQEALNLERALPLGERLDGHIVQGHVDGTAVCVSREEKGGSHVFRFIFPEAFAALLIEKGSVCINGVSLTAFNVTSNSFEVTIIPYTLAHTTFQYLQVNSVVNIEYDLIGKYFLRSQSLQQYHNK
jgi:riboflavin synthase